MYTLPVACAAVSEVNALLLLFSKFMRHHNRIAGYPLILPEVLVVRQLSACALHIGYYVIAKIISQQCVKIDITDKIIVYTSGLVLQ